MPVHLVTGNFSTCGDFGDTVDGVLVLGDKIGLMAVGDGTMKESESPQGLKLRKTGQTLNKFLWCDFCNILNNIRQHSMSIFYILPHLFCIHPTGQPPKFGFYLLCSGSGFARKHKHLWSIFCKVHKNRIPIVCHDAGGLQGLQVTNQAADKDTCNELCQLRYAKLEQLAQMVQDILPTIHSRPTAAFIIWTIQSSEAYMYIR